MGVSVIIKLIIMEIILRDYQKAASDKAVAFFKDKNKKSNGIMVLPTGAGKSIVIADIAHRLNDYVLIFCPSVKSSNRTSKSCVLTVSLIVASIRLPSTRSR